MTLRGIFLLLLLGLVGLGGMRWLGACGPGYLEPLFQDPGILDVSRAELAQGRFGVLRPGLPWQDLIRVYRGLRGAAPAAAPVPAALPEGAALTRWQAARAKVLGPGPGPEVAARWETETYVTVVHISDDALVQAARTLEALAPAHDAAAVKDWIRAQDLVFGSTPKAPRIPLAVAEPAWLAQEREYQIAAARFYAGQWEPARTGFLGLAATPGHPRAAWGRYLAARCWVREGEFSGDPAFKLACYAKAQALTEALLADPASAALQGPARAYRELARYRTEPLVLLGEFLEDQSRPQPADPDLEPRIRDALRALGAVGWKTGPHQAKAESAPVAAIPMPGSSDLALWLGALAGNVPWETTGAQALEQWRQRGTGVWLLAALARAETDGPELEALKTAAGAVPPGSALAPTLRWHLLRLALAGLQGPALATALEAGLQRPDLPPWAVNVLRQKRQALALTPAEWFTYAARKLSATRDDDFGAGIQLPVSATPRECFEPATAQALGAQLPLAQVPALLGARLGSPQAARELAVAAWTKAVVLEAWDLARALTPHLPEPLAAAATQALSGTDPVALRFQVALLLLDWPGLRPAVAAGLGRQHAWSGLKPGQDSLSSFDILRDNWWCGQAAEPRPAAATRAIPGLTAAELQAARAEQAQLDRLPAAQVGFGRCILAFAKAHPEDPRVPMALHRFVAGTRSPRCPSAEMTTLGRAAHGLLHRHYARSPWTRKTPYYY